MTCAYHAFHRLQWCISLNEVCLWCISLNDVCLWCISVNDVCLWCISVPTMHFSAYSSYDALQLCLWCIVPMMHFIEWRVPMMHFRSAYHAFQFIDSFNDECLWCISGVLMMHFRGMIYWMFVSEPIAFMCSCCANKSGEKQSGKRRALSASLGVVNSEMPPMCRYRKGGGVWERWDGRRTHYKVNSCGLLWLIESRAGSAGGRKFKHRARGGGRGRVHGGYEFVYVFVLIRATQPI